MLFSWAECSTCLKFGVAVCCFYEPIFTIIVPRLVCTCPQGPFFFLKKPVFENYSPPFGVYVPAGAFFSSKNLFWRRGGDPGGHWGDPGGPWGTLGGPWGDPGGTLGDAGGTLGAPSGCTWIQSCFGEVPGSKVMALPTKYRFRELISGFAGFAGFSGSAGNGVTNCYSDPPFHTRRGPG